jgi:LPXTG-motif cell wall-anchored protein
VGMRRLAGRMWSGFGLPGLWVVLWLMTVTPVALAGQGGGQIPPAADNSALWVIGGLIGLMLVSGFGLLYTRRKK